MNLLDLLFPKKCCQCRKIGQYICAACLKKVRLVTKSYTSNKYLDGFVSCFYYEGVIKRAILDLKYHFIFDLASELTSHFLTVFYKKKIRFEEDSIVTCIPLHSSRQRWRGFNQSELIASNFASSCNLSFKKNILRRISQAQPQAKLSKELRLRNIRGKFALIANPSLLKDAKIILFDDVYTTGATLNEAARVLKEAGAKSVWGISVAR